jgi:diguanylate cyclase (GGDEF)-like protein
VAVRSPFLGIVVPVLSIIAIGWIDYVTGPDIGCSLFYLLPVALGAWHGGIRAAMIAGVAATAAWLTADLLWRQGDVAMAISLWNAFTRLVIYLSEGFFIAILRRDREVMHRLVAREAALARTDSVTSLANSRAFLEALETEVARGGPLSVVYFDLDHFKLVNDRQGHRVGDDVLTEVAKGMRESIRTNDVAARVGGDEFAILVRDDADVARYISEELVRRVRAIGLAKGEPRLGATVGIATLRDGMTAEELLHEADVAMYTAKGKAKGSVVFATQNA